MVIRRLADGTEPFPSEGLQFGQRRAELVRLGQGDERFPGQESIPFHFRVKGFADIVLPRMKGGLQQPQVLLTQASGNEQWIHDRCSRISFQTVTNIPLAVILADQRIA